MQIFELRRPRPAQQITLVDEALRAEHTRHAARLKEIDGLASDLQRLQQHLPALRAAGVELGGHECANINGLFIHGGQDRARNGRMLQAFMGMGGKARNKAAFKDGGFAVELDLGGLHLAFYVDPRAAAAGAQGGVA